MSGFIDTPTRRDIQSLERRITLLERQSRLPELREELAINVGRDVLVKAAHEANERTGEILTDSDAIAFTQIVVDVINRSRS